MNPSVELVSTGAELLSGRTVNTHAQLLAQHLALLGLPLVRDTTVPDERAVLRAALAEALQRVSIVIVSGGLGATSDDITRDAVADLTGEPLVIHEPTRAHIRQRYEQTGRVWTETVSRNALIVSGAEVLSNRVGLAPGEMITWQDKLIVLMPGPPREFEAILVDHLVPHLRAFVDEQPLQHVFELVGIGESDVVRLLPETGFPGPGVGVAYCARPANVELRLSALPASAAEHARAVAVARERLGEWIYAEAPVDLEFVVIERLRKAGQSVAVAESCTGGLIGHRLTNVPGSSEVFLGGVIAYANASKTRELGVSAGLIETVGAVSSEVAIAMAEGVCARFGADYGIGVTGIAGPGGGSAEKPVGLVHIAVAAASGTLAKKFDFSGTRETIKERSAQMALDLLRRRLPAR